MDKSATLARGDDESNHTGLGAKTDKIPPEEGLQGWLCVAGSFLSIFSTFGLLSASGVFQSVYQQGVLRHYSASVIALIFAVQLSLMWLPGPLVTRLLDAYGAAPVLIPCTALAILGLATASLATEYYQIFLSQGLALGLGSGGVFTTSLVCVGQWFVRRRGLAAGIASAGSSLGGVIFPFYFVKVSARIGLPGAMRYAALLNGILLSVSCFLVRSRLPRKNWDSESKWLDWSLLKRHDFALYSLGAFLTMWGLWGPLNFVSSMALDSGFPPDLALYLVSILNASMVPGRVIPPYVADRIGHFKVMTACSLLTAVSILGLWLPFNYHPVRAGIIVFALVYGFVSGAVISLLLPCAAKAGSLETLSQRFGTFQVVIGLSCLTGLPIMGAILNAEHNVNYLGVQLFSGVSCLLGGLILVQATRLFSPSGLRD